jgi:hypothetical protein
MINQLSIILLCDTQILNGLKNIETKCLAEASKLFIGVWCIRNTDISFICKDRAGEPVVAQSWPYPGFPVLHVFSSLP